MAEPAKKKETDMLSDDELMRLLLCEDEEFKDVTRGTYPVDGVPRGKGMTCVTGGNELNALTLTKCHVNGMFLPPHVGDNYLGYENDYEGAVRLADH